MYRGFQVPDHLLGEQKVSPLQTDKLRLQIPNEASPLQTDKHLLLTLNEAGVLCLHTQTGAPTEGCQVAAALCHVPLLRIPLMLKLGA